MISILGDFRRVVVAPRCCYHGIGWVDFGRLKSGARMLWILEGFSSVVVASRCCRCGIGGVGMVLIPGHVMFAFGSGREAMVYQLA